MKRENWKKQKSSVIPLPRQPLSVEGSLGVSLCPPSTSLLTCHRFLQVKPVGQWVWTWSSWYTLPTAFYIPCSWSCSYLLWDRLSHGGLQGAVSFTAEKNLFDCILSSHSDSLLAIGVIENSLFVSELIQKPSLVSLFKLPSLFTFKIKTLFKRLYLCRLPQ